MDAVDPLPVPDPAPNRSGLPTDPAPRPIRLPDRAGSRPGRRVPGGFCRREPLRSCTMSRPGRS